MTIPRIFIDANLKIKATILLNEAASRHVVQALRLKIKDQLIIFNKTGGEFKAQLTEIKGLKATVFLEEFINCNNESPLTIHLGQSISRGEKMDFTIQKAVELGINAITPLFTDYCNVKLEPVPFPHIFANS